jgi:flagellar hook-length control protein FliK
MAVDVRSLMTTGAGGVTLSSPSLEGGAITVHDAADIPQQIVQAMKLQWNNGVGDARIKLQPEYLGELAITIRVDRGDVTATLQASTPQVRQWIEGHESMLRQMLSDRGLQLDKFVVTDERPPSSSDEEAQGREPQERQQSNRRRATTGATFEVTA